MRKTKTFFANNRGKFHKRYLQFLSWKTTKTIYTYNEVWIRILLKQVQPVVLNHRWSFYMSKLHTAQTINYCHKISFLLICTEAEDWTRVNDHRIVLEPKTSTSTLLLEFCYTPEADRLDLTIRKIRKNINAHWRPMLRVYLSCVRHCVMRQSTRGHVKDHDASV